MNPSPGRADAPSAARRYTPRPGLVDASAARARVGELRAAGMSVRGIARAAGVNRTALRELAAGRTRWVSAASAAALARVDPVPARGSAQATRLSAVGGESAARRPGRLVDATLVRQHVAVLRAAGMRNRDLADLADLDDSTVSRLSPGSARPARRLSAPAAARVLAVRPGDHLDEAAISRAVAGERIALSPPERAVVARRLAAAGVSRSRIAARLRMSRARAAQLVGRPASSPSLAA